MAVFDGQFSIFKGKSVARFTVLDPKIEESSVRPGCVLLEVAPAVGERKYNWEAKQTFGITAAECAALARKARSYAAGENGSLSFYHDPEAGSKDAEKGAGKKLSFNKKDAGETSTFIGIKDISVALTCDEVYAIAVLLEQAFPYVLAWPKLS